MEPKLSLDAVRHLIVNLSDYKLAYQSFYKLAQTTILGIWIFFLVLPVVLASLYPEIERYLLIGFIMLALVLSRVVGPLVRWILRFYLKSVNKPLGEMIFKYLTYQELIKNHMNQLLKEGSEDFTKDLITRVHKDLNDEKE